MSPTSIEALSVELNPDITALGEEIRRAREFRRMTLHTLAAAADVGLQTLVRLEAGHAGVSVLILQKVLRVLGIESRLLLAGAGDSETAYRPCHVQGERTQQALLDAAGAACKVLDGFLQERADGAAAHPGIGPEFRQQLKAHLQAMLCGVPGDPKPGVLPALVYSERSLGGPLRSANEQACVGWVLCGRVYEWQRASLSEEAPVWLGDKVVAVSDPQVSPFDSRDEALLAFAAWVNEHGHPPMPLDLVPVYDGVNGGLTYAVPR